MIRFQRVGRANDPSFRIVVTERRSKPKTSGIEIVGSFHPKTKATILKAERILYWLSKGAKLSPSVHNLLVTKRVLSLPKINVLRVKKSGTQTEPAPQAAAGAVSAA